VVEITREFDPRVLDILWKHPAVYSKMGDDFLPPAQDVSLIGLTQAESIKVYIATQIGMPFGAITYERHITPITYEIHCGFLPGCRGKQARDAIGLTLVDMFQNGALKITAQFPSARREVAYLARRLGFEHEGVNRQSVIQDGRLQNQLYMGLTKDAWHRLSTVRKWA
jgi:RimJ/RimL family protein N-acetyltransferase